MHLSHPGRRGLVALALLALAGVLATVLLLGRSAQPAIADNNPNNYDCRGHVAKGAASADDLGATEVKYLFAC